jgi:ubiquinone/menaquinone biosynthesis C-methylase UbiE
MARPSVRMFISRYYDLIAPGYDRVWRRYVERTASLAARHIADGDDQTILDVGCGTGYLLSILERRCPRSRLFGIDASPRMLAQASELLDRAELRDADARRLPYDDGSMDVVTTLSMLQHVDDPFAVVDEMARVCRATATMVIVAWNASSSFNRLYQATLGRIDPSFVSLVDHGDLEARLSTHGFRLEHSNRESVGRWGLSVVVGHR